MTTHFLELVAVLSKYTCIFLVNDDSRPGEYLFQKTRTADASRAFSNAELLNPLKGLYLLVAELFFFLPFTVANNVLWDFLDSFLQGINQPFTVHTKLFRFSALSLFVFSSRIFPAILLELSCSSSCCEATLFQLSWLASAMKLLQGGSLIKIFLQISALHFNNAFIKIPNCQYLLLSQHLL